MVCDLYCTLVHVFSMVVQLCFVIDTIQYKCTGKTPLSSFYQLGDKGLRFIREHLLRFQTNLGTRTSVGLFISMLPFESHQLGAKDLSCIFRTLLIISDQLGDKDFSWSIYVHVTI